MDQENKAAVEKMKAPSNMKDVRAVLGLVGSYKIFIPGFEKSSESLYQLLTKQKKFLWTKEREGALHVLKGRLPAAPILGYPDDRDEYTLTTDRSLTAMGTILTQNQEGVDIFCI